jgi:hypothetical protein
MAAYPEHDWDPAKFNKRTNKFWMDAKNRKQFFDNLALKLGITKYEDWYKVRTIDVVNNGGNALLRHHSSSLYKGKPNGVYYI